MRLRSLVVLLLFVACAPREQAVTPVVVAPAERVAPPAIVAPASVAQQTPAPQEPEAADWFAPCEQLLAVVERWFRCIEPDAAMAPTRLEELRAQLRQGGESPEGRPAILERCKKGVESISKLTCPQP